MSQAAPFRGRPATYLPIRTIETAPGESAASDQAIRDDYRWLPDTAADLSLLTPAGAVPAGFTQVPDAGAATRVLAGKASARWPSERIFRCGPVGTSIEDIAAAAGHVDPGVRRSVYRH